MKRSILAFSASGLAAIALSLAERPPLVAWNASPSAPAGLYLIERREPSIGEIAAVWLPSAIAGIAAGRGYLPEHALLIKNVAAASGMHICGIGFHTIIGWRIFVRARRRDFRGRPLYRWAGCRRLRPDEIFLLGSGRSSFDSRYFGPVTMAQVVGRARAIWTWSPR